MGTTTKKLTRKMFTPEFKMEVLSYYYTHGEHRRKTYEKFGISETNLRQWQGKRMKIFKITTVLTNLWVLSTGGSAP